MGRQLLLNLSTQAIELGVFKADFKDFANRFKTTYSFTPPVFETIKFHALADKINTAANSYIDEPKDDDSFLRGIRFYLGMENVEDVWKIRLVVVPVCLNLSTTAPGNPPQNFVFTPYSSSFVANQELYKIENEQLTAISHLEANQLTQNYYDNITISQSIPPSTPFENYDSPVDVKAIFFPFQEIAAVFCDNFHQGTTPIADDRLYITSISVQNPASGLYKHTLAISPTEPVDDDKLAGTFTGKVADVANLCPPNCPNVVIARSVVGTRLVGVIQN